MSPRFFHGNTNQVLPAGMRNAEIGIGVADGAIMLGRLWESASRAYQFEVHDLLDRDVSDQEIGF